MAVTKDARKSRLEQLDMDEMIKLALKVNNWTATPFQSGVRYDGSIGKINVMVSKSTEERGVVRETNKIMVTMPTTAKVPVCTLGSAESNGRKSRERTDKIEDLYFDIEAKVLAKREKEEAAKEREFIRKGVEQARKILRRS